MIRHIPSRARPRLRLEPTRLPLVIGCATVGLYIAFAAVAATRFPAPYSPLHNWLSDLGNHRLNPDGAYFYQAGSAVAGVLMACFFVSLSPWRTSSRGPRYALYLMQSLGLLAGAALIMTAVFPENDWHTHQLWSKTVFGSFSLALIVSLFAFPARRRRYRALAPLAIVCAIVVLADGADERPVLEWLSVATFLTFILIFGIALNVVGRQPDRR